MELLMPLTVDEVLEERRKTAARKCVVVESERAAVVMRQVVEEGVQVLHPGVMQGGQGQRFDLIVMAMKPGPMGMRWFEEAVMTALRPGGKLEWVVPRLSLA